MVGWIKGEKGLSEAQMGQGIGCVFKNLGTT